MTVIAVVGGGLAGLACLARLVRDLPDTSPCRLMLLERSNSVGGRLDTRSWGSSRVEMGAEWLHGWHGHTLARLARCFDLQVQPTSQVDALHIDLLSGRTFEPLDQQLESAFRSRAVELFQTAVERLDKDRSVAAVLSEIRASAHGRQLEQELTRGSIQDALPAWLPKRRLIARGLHRFVWPRSGMAAVQHRLMNWTYNEQLGLDLGTAPADVSARRIFADYFDYLQWRRGEARIVEGFGALAAGLLAWIRDRASQKPGLQLTVDFGVEVLEVVRGDRLSLRFVGPRGAGEHAVDAAVVTCPVWHWQTQRMRCDPLPDPAFRRALDGLGVAHLARCVVRFAQPVPLRHHYVNLVDPDLISSGLPCQWYRLEPDLLVGIAYGEGAVMLEQKAPESLERELRELAVRLRWPRPMALLTSERLLDGGSFSYPRVAGVGRPFHPWQDDHRLACAGEHAVPEPDFGDILERARAAHEQTFESTTVDDLLDADPGMALPAVSQGAFYSGLRAAEAILAAHGR